MCGAPTNGIFNVAKDMVKKLKKMKERAEKGSVEEVKSEKSDPHKDGLTAEEREIMAEFADKERNPK